VVWSPRRAAAMASRIGPAWRGRRAAARMYRDHVRGVAPRVADPAPARVTTDAP
jgi:hypothetical protein